MNDPRIGQVLTGTYRLERLLGRGSMGLVYEATHLRVPRRFAVKLLVHEVASHQTAVQRFRREAEITGRIGHPNIVEVIDFNTSEDGQPYLVMELLEGEDLGDRLERVGRLPARDVLAVLEQAGSALQAAHDCDVVHRDLKPRNLFICRRPDGERLKVVDFGISKILGVPSSLTQSAGVFGSPYYMSPEQADGQHDLVDRRTDIYAMGVLLYQMLAGRLPFEGAPLAVLYQIVHSDPPRLEDVYPEVPRPVADVVHGALARDPAQRTPSMSALVDAFRRAAASAGAPIAPTAGPAPARTGLWIAGGAVALLALVALAALLALGDETTPARSVLARAPDRGAPTSDAWLAAHTAPDAAPVAAPDTMSAPDAAARRARAAVRGRGKSRRTPGRRQQPVPGAPAVLRVVTLFNGRSLWAEVRLDGQAIGRTPVYNRAVPPGAHTVEIRRSGFRTIVHRVHFKPGEQRRLMFDLEAAHAPR